MGKFELEPLSKAHQNWLQSREGYMSVRGGSVNDLQVIGAWFNLVRNIKNKHGIQQEDIYGFDKTGF